MTASGLELASRLAVALTVATIAVSCTKDEPKPRLLGSEPGLPTPGTGPSSPTPTGDGGTGVSFATAPSSIRGLALTASHVYFVYVEALDAGVDDAGTSGGVLARVPKAGGAIEVVVRGGAAPRSLAFTGTSLMWIDDGGASSSLVIVDDTSARPLATGLAPASQFAAAQNGIVVASAAVGSLNIDLVPTSDAGTIASLGTVLGNVTPVRVAALDTNAFVLVGESPGANLYRTPTTSASVPESIWSAAGGVPRDLAVVAGHAFVAIDSGTQGQVVSIPLPGGAPQTLVGPIDAPAHLALDGDQLFLTTDTGQLLRIPSAGGESAVVATDLGVPAALAVASDAAFVATGNRIVRVGR